jgi:hypothetical protein
MLVGNKWWLETRVVEFLLSELMSVCVIWKNYLLALTAKGCDFDEFECGGLHEKHTVATWELCTTSALV